MMTHSQAALLAIFLTLGGKIASCQLLPVAVSDSGVTIERTASNPKPMSISMTQDQVFLFLDEKKIGKTWSVSVPATLENLTFRSGYLPCIAVHEKLCAVLADGETVDILDAASKEAVARIKLQARAGPITRAALNGGILLVMSGSRAQAKLHAYDLRAGTFAGPVTVQGEIPRMRLSPAGPSSFLLLDVALPELRRIEVSHSGERLAMGPPLMLTGGEIEYSKARAKATMKSGAVTLVIGAHIPG